MSRLLIYDLLKQEGDISSKLYDDGLLSRIIAGISFAGSLLQSG
ncbi:MAG: hypothetical protein WBL67_11640 [Nitrososphaeraceae archaeon]